VQLSVFMERAMKRDDTRGILATHATLRRICIYVRGGYLDLLYSRLRFRRATQPTHDARQKLSPFI